MGSLVDLNDSINFDSGALPFQLPITVRRPSEGPITTTGIRVLLGSEEFPAGATFQRNEEQWAMKIRQSTVPTMPLKTIIDAPKRPGGLVESWRVDKVELEGAEHYFVLLIPEP